MSALLLVGVLVIASTSADVKHVLDGSAHPPDPNSISPHAVNHLATQYWWMDADSPLKAAYDYYKRCAAKNNCVSPVDPAAPPPQPFVPTVNINVKKNPFLNGDFNSQSGNAAYNDKPKIDIKKNPFLNGAVLTAGDGAPVSKDVGGFLGVQPAQPFGKKPGFATTHPLEQKDKKPGFATTHPLEQKDKKPGFATTHPLEKGALIFDNVTVECKGKGFACVEKSECLNGVVNTNGEGILQVRSDVSYCREDTEVCCQMNNLNEITAGKSSTIKFAGGSGFSPGLIHVQPQPDIIFAGEHGHHSSSTSKSIRDTSLSPNSVFSSTVDYSDTQFDSNVRFASTFQGPGYLPPVGPSTPAPRPFETKQPNINQQYFPSRPSTQKYIPPAPTTPRPAPSSTYRPAPSATTPAYRPPAPSTTFRPAPPVTFRPAPSTSYRPPVTFKPAPTTSREYLPPRPSTPRPTTTNNQPYQPSTPKPYQPSTPAPRPYQPSTPAPRPYQPSTPAPRPYQPSTPKPYQPQPTPAPNPAGGYDYPKPTPSFGYPSTSRPVFGNSNVNNQYIPPPKKPGDNPDQSYEAANVDGAFVRPTTPRTSFQGELNTAPPPGCAAALKCVQEIYCTAEGVISPVPVVLTKEQELSRVPTTVCQDTESGIIGKCCRDPNYKDPWPSANLVDGVDDGQYKEDNNFGQYSPDLQRPVRSDKGGPRQDFSSTRNTNVEVQPTCGERHKNTNPPGPGPLDVNFAEIPWQAMILRDSNRSLLCGGAIIRRDAVLTAAHCIEGIETSDILIKGGEWKLGIDEEPLPFQIVKVSVVVRHPQYQKGSFVNDLALLILEEKLRPAKNIGTVCLPPPNQIPTNNCIATGWGKRILQLHAKGAIMHSIDVKIMDNQQCQETLANTFQHASSNYSPNTLCGYSDIDQCRVDYGSALACSDGNQYTLSGIYAWDTGCKQKGQIGGYVAPDVDWIESTLAKPVRELKLIEQN